MNKPRLSDVKYLIDGDINQEWILPLLGSPVEGTLGGHLPYALAGLLVWDSNVGLLSKISDDFPPDLLNWLDQPGVDHSGVSYAKKKLESRLFYAYEDPDQPIVTSPMQIYSKRELSFPKELLGYSPIIEKYTNVVQETDIPHGYYEATSLHLCPSAYLSQLAIQALFRKSQVTTLTIDAAASYMVPEKSMISASSSLV